MAGGLVVVRGTSNFVRWVLLICLLAFVVASGVPIYGQRSYDDRAGRNLTFEVATVRPSRSGTKGEDWDSQGDRVQIQGYSLRKLIKAAFGLSSDAQIAGGPDWLDTRLFDISAKISDEEIAAFKGADGERREQRDIDAMLQTLLRDRFKLRVNLVERMLPAFRLISDPKQGGLVPDSTKEHSLSVRGGHLMAVATSMEELADELTRMREVNDRPVRDQTGLPGRYDFELRWTPERGGELRADTTYPGLFEALRKQLGLTLKAGKLPLPVIEVVAAQLPAAE